MRVRPPDALLALQGWALPAVRVIDFFVPGIAKSTQTGSVIRLKNGRAIPLRRGTGWSAVCGLVARQYAPAKPLAGPVAVALRFVIARPKTTRREWPTVRPDLENYVKGIADSWVGVLYDDDSQIVRLTAEKVYGDTPGVNVTVEAL